LSGSISTSLGNNVSQASLRPVGTSRLAATPQPIQSAPTEAPIADTFVAPAPPSLASQASTIPGTQFAQSPTGGTLTADNGLALRQDGGNYQLKLPGGDQIVWDGKNQPVGVGADGAFKVESHLDQAGLSTGYSYQAKDGTEVFINRDDMSVVYRNQKDGVTQHLDSEGGQFIVAKNNYKGSSGDATMEQQIYIDPKGQVHNLKGDPDGLLVSKTQVSFKNPTNWQVAARLPRPLDFTPTGQFCYPTGGSQPNPSPAGGAQPAPPVNPNPNQPLSWAEPNPDVPSANEGRSQIIRTRTPDGSLCITTRNGIAMMAQSDGKSYALDPRQEKGSDSLPVSVGLHELPNGQFEHKYTFNDAKGGRYTMFEHSEDMYVQSGDNRVNQHIYPDGSIFMTVAGDQGQLYEAKVLPDGTLYEDPGLKLDKNLTSGDKDRLYLQGANGQPEELGIPYPIPGDINYSTLGIHGVSQNVDPILEGKQPIPGPMPPEGLFPNGGGPVPGFPGPVGFPRLNLPGFPTPGLQQPGPAANQAAAAPAFNPFYPNAGH
jgi:hypothetical protein